MMSEKQRYRVQVIDQARSYILADATLLGALAVVDMVRSALDRNPDLHGSLQVRIDQLAGAP